MGKKKDIKIEKPGNWDEFVKADTEEALSEIYKHAQKFSETARNWYWKSIASKRNYSRVVRFISFLLLLCGVVLPILTGILSEVSMRLIFTQTGVVVLAIAGLLQAADQIFGWSSGWLRYMTTVTAMETVTRKFELDWANYLISQVVPLKSNNKQPLFELAKKFENDISQLQIDETTKWVAAFNSSLALLNDLIKSQRESTEKTAEITRSVAAAQESAAAAKEKEQQPGGIELSLIHKAKSAAVKLHIDNDPEIVFTGTLWSTLQVLPGLHIIHVTTTTSVIQTFQKTVNVPAGGVGYAEIKLS